MNKFVFLSAFGLLVSHTVFASDSISNLPTPIHSGSATYLSGGIGQGEVSAFKQVASSYPLELEFLVKATPRDEYTANVKVSIVDSRHQNVVDTVAQGPFLLARLPDGCYRIEASDDGIVKTRYVVVKAKMPTKLTFEWPA